MSDFYTLLKESIIERDIRDAGERDEIYAQARRAMIRRLWAFDPPLGEDEIDQRIGAFDVAVSDIESDLVAAFSEGDADIAGEADIPAARARQMADRAREAGAAILRETEAGPLIEDRRSVEGEPGDDRVRLPPSRALAPAGRSRYAPPEGGSRSPVRYEAPAEPYYDDGPAADTDYRYEEVAERREHQADDETGGAPLPPPRRRTRERERVAGKPLSDESKIRILLGAIGACLLALVAIGVYLLLPDRDGGVTVDIGVRREVSDAATAVRVAAEDLPVDQTFMLFDGRDPTIFEASADNPVRFDANGGVVRISSSTGAPGVRALIGPGLATRLAGRRVRVVLVARASREAGAAGMRFAYQSGLAISHWQTANLGADYGSVAIVWRVPALRTDRAGDYLLVEPGIPGDGTGVDIKTIRIDLLAS